MQIDEVSKAVFKFSRLLGKNAVLVLLCTSSILQGVSADEDKLSLETISSEEIAAFDSTPLIQKPLEPQDFQIPAPSFEPRAYKSPFLTVTLSSLLPGLGHVYLGDMKTAGGLIGATGVGVGITSFGYPNASALETGVLTLQTTWFYGMYAAYRDVRIYNGQSGYRYKMPTDSLSDLTLAPFSWSVLKKPEVWGGLLGSFAVLFTAGYLAFSSETRIHPPLSFQAKLKPLFALPVGVGEESFFRGYLQSQLSEALTPWGGIALSSLAFGAVHLPNALLLEPEDRKNYCTIIVPLIALSGVYDGWLTYKNQSLKESVALHTWYDFVVFTIGSLAGQAAITGRSEFAVSIPF